MIAGAGVDAAYHARLDGLDQQTWLRLEHATERVTDRCLLIEQRESDPDAPEFRPVPKSARATATPVMARAVVTE